MPSSRQLTLGRSFALVFDHGEDFFPTLTDFCATHNIRQGYIPMFIAGFATVDIVGTCDKLDNPQAPVWTKVHLTNVEAIGAGTIAWNPATKTISPHIHVAVGLKELSAQGYTSHLLDARVQFLVEMIITEVAEPSMHRLPNPALYDAPQLHLGSPTPEA